MKNKIIVSVGIISVCMMLFTGVSMVSANPLAFFRLSPSVATSSAVTIAYASGPSVNATTTFTWDSYNNGNATGIKEASVLIQEVSSSTPANALNWRWEFSQDGIDWYPESVENSTNATTTTMVNTYKEYRWQFATSSGGTSGNIVDPKSQKILKMVSVPVPTRYVRGVFYVDRNGVAGGTTTVYADFVGKKENY